MANTVASIGPALAVPAVTTAGTHATASSFPVAGVAPVAPVQAAESGGNAPPASGEALPAAAAAPVPQGDLIQLQAVVAGVNQFLRDSQRQIVFQFDPQSDKEQVTIVNPATGEVIRQIPAAQVLSTAQSLQQAGILMPGLLLDASA
jgi:hypothetical protein